MNFHRPSAHIFVPDGLEPAPALARTTHMGIAAHADDLEIMAVAGILACYQQPHRWFTGVVVSDGRGSPRSGPYAAYDDGQMRDLRIAEQKQAADIGAYAAQVLLDYPSAVLKGGEDRRPLEDLVRLVELARPRIVYTHNFADRHDTHVAVAARVVQALRALPTAARPARLYGMEVWRDLDWLLDADRVAFDVSRLQELQQALLAVFASQLGGGKRYDLAALGRRRAHATFHTPHAVDASSGLSLGMDLTPLIEDESLDVEAYVLDHIDRFALDVRERIRRLSLRPDVG